LRCRKKLAIVERIDVEDAQGLAFVGQNQRNTDAASSANDLARSFKSERVFLDLLRISRCHRDLRVGIRKSPSIVFAAKRTLTSANDLDFGRPISRQLYANGPAATLAVKEHVSAERASSKRGTRMRP
jgi:hypothetical protein